MALRSPLPDFGAMSPPLDASEADGPPPWPPGADPRTPECRHDWPIQWGRTGERQHECIHCGRWIWERAIWPEEES